MSCKGGFRGPGGAGIGKYSLFCSHLRGGDVSIGLASSKSRASLLKGISIAKKGRNLFGHPLLQHEKGTTDVNVSFCLIMRPGRKQATFEF